MAIEILIKEYAEKVYRMRNAQKAYFTNRQSRNKEYVRSLLVRSKDIEKQVDDITDDILGHKL